MEAIEQRKPVWRCKVEGCGYTRPPTKRGYRQLKGHQLAHASMPKAKKGIILVDETTGEVLANKFGEATEKGFVAPEPLKVTSSGSALGEVPKPSPPSPPEAEAETEPEAKGKGEKEVTEPQVSTEGILRYTFPLPSPLPFSLPFYSSFLSSFSGIRI